MRQLSEGRCERCGRAGPVWRPFLSPEELSRMLAADARHPDDTGPVLCDGCEQDVRAELMGLSRN